MEEHEFNKEALSASKLIVECLAINEIPKDTAMCALCIVLGYSINISENPKEYLEIAIKDLRKMSRL